MSNLGDHLEGAAGPPEPALDLAALNARAAGRAKTKRRALAGGAVAVLLLVGGIGFTATQGDGGSGQLVTASEGDGTGTTEVADTTVPDTASTVVETTEAPTTSVPEGTATTGTTLVEPGETATTVPPTVPPAPPTDTWFRVGGTYTGHEQYRMAQPGDCRGDEALSHGLLSTLTVTDDYDGTADPGPWTYKSDYCSTVEGSTWSGSGTFAISMEDGSQLLGTITDTTAYPTDGEPYTVQVTAGTGRYAGASGTCEFTVHITDKVFGSQTQRGDFKCEVGPGGGTDAPGGSATSAAFG